ncbi:hypothetical protein DET49_11739 [Salegentibacter sp. 24]|nr:hypothetical protein DET49_11739 [Salegentibacter sp. 24]
MKMKKSPNVVTEKKRDFDFSNPLFFLVARPRFELGTSGL